MKLKRNGAIATGASRGTGKATAIGFAKEGAYVVMAARSEALKKGLEGPFTLSLRR